MKFVVAGGVAASVVSVSLAGTITFSMQNGNGGGGAFNTTLFEIANTSGGGVNLTRLDVSVGDTQYLFDQLYASEELFTGGNGSQTATLLIGDRSDDNAGPDLFSYAFANFGPGVSFRGQWDIDNDNGDFNADMRSVFFNNGAAPNATITCAFSDGSAFTYAFADLPSQDSYSLVIPTPGAAGLGLFGAALTLVRRRR